LLKRTEIMSLSSDNRMSIGQAAVFLQIPEKLLESMIIEGKLERIKSSRVGSDGAILMKKDVEELKRKVDRLISVEEFVASSGTPKGEIERLVASGRLLPLSGADIDDYRFSALDLEWHMRLCSRKDAAALLCVAPDTIENWRKKGLVKAESHEDLRGRTASFYRVKDLECLREVGKPGRRTAVMNLEAKAGLDAIGIV
jgi:hypothetical protein